jgi:3-deoxy-D-manno-octulosonate 8-phosphate phosphatase (KDO 8-P phosphatase)
MPSRLPGPVRARLDPIRLVVLDVDGVLTDGVLFYGPRGEELKCFSVRDGLAIRMLRSAGIEVGVITGRSTEALAARCRDLGIREDLVIQGSRDKSADLDRIEQRLELTDRQIAVMGDDLPDVPVLERAGFSACPADASPEVAAVCDLVCGAPGGRGAVRELAELLLKARGLWQAQVGRWIGPASGAGEGQR